MCLPAKSWRCGHTVAHLISWRFWLVIKSHHMIWSLSAKWQQSLKDARLFLKSSSSTSLCCFLVCLQTGFPHDACLQNQSFDRRRAGRSRRIAGVWAMLCKVSAIMPYSNYQQRNQKRLDGKNMLLRRWNAFLYFWMWKSLHRSLDMFANDSLKYLTQLQIFTMLWSQKISLSPFSLPGWLGCLGPRLSIAFWRVWDWTRSGLTEAVAGTEFISTFAHFSSALLAVAGDLESVS